MNRMLISNPTIKDTGNWLMAGKRLMTSLLLMPVLATTLACPYLAEVYVSGEVREINGQVVALLNGGSPSELARARTSTSADPVPGLLSLYVCENPQGDPVGNTNDCVVYEESFLFSDVIPAIHIPDLEETGLVYVSSEMLLEDGRLYRTRDLLQVNDGGATLPYDPYATRPDYFLVAGEQGPTVELVYSRQIDLSTETNTITDIELNVIVDEQVDEVIADMTAPMYSMVLDGCLSNGDALTLTTSYEGLQLKGVEPDEYAKVWLIPGTVCSLDIDIADPGGDWIYTNPPHTFEAPPGDRSVHLMTETLEFKQAESNINAHFEYGATLTNMELYLDEVAVAYLSNFPALTYRADFVRYVEDGDEVIQMPLERVDNTLTGNIEGLEESYWEVYVYALEGDVPVLTGHGEVDLSTGEPDASLTFMYEALIDIPSDWAANIFPQAMLADNLRATGGVSIAAEGILSDCTPTSDDPEACLVVATCVTGSYAYDDEHVVSYAPYTGLLQLPPGVYDLTFSHSGYGDQRVENFEVSEFDDPDQPDWIVLEQAD